MKDEGAALGAEVARQMRELLERRALAIVFQPIWDFREARFAGYEALARGPAGSPLESPLALFAAARALGLAVVLNIVCIQEVLRAFSRFAVDARLFLNVSPEMIMQPGFDPQRARRFMRSVGVEPERVVIELTEDYPTFDFRAVEESLMLYRAMGFRVAIDDMGEGFASLRLWSELKPEFVKADKHFVRGIAADPVKLEFLRAMQKIAETSGSLVVAEGIETAEDFRMVRELGIACGQGWFIGRPHPEPRGTLSEAARLAHADTRVPVPRGPPLRAGREPCAGDFLRPVDAIVASAPLERALERFAGSPEVAAIPVVGTDGIQGIVSRAWERLARHPGIARRVRARPCREVMDRLPICVDAALDLGALVALLMEADPGRFADGFVIQSRGRYAGMGSSRDVLRSVRDSHVLAARYTHPLTLLPGEVPIHAHLVRLLDRQAPFSVWYAALDGLRGLNDAEGFEKGDALIHACARLLESACEPGIDFVGHRGGSRFAVLMQSHDWRARADDVLERFAGLVATHVPPEALARGLFVLATRDGRSRGLPLPRLAIGIVTVAGGGFESRHEVLAAAKRAYRRTALRPGNALAVAESGGQAVRSAA